MEPVPKSFSVSCPDVEDTGRVASAVATRLAAGDVVILTGDLGAGKTTFVQRLVAAMGSAAPVTSPTFTLAQFYETPGPTVLHIDAYRLDSVAEYRELGLEEFVETSVTLVEWGELVASQFDDPLVVAIETAETGRTITMSCAEDSSRWAGVLSDLRPALVRQA